MVLSLVMVVHNNVNGVVFGLITVAQWQWPYSSGLTEVAP